MAISAQRKAPTACCGVVPAATWAWGRLITGPGVVGLLRATARYEELLVTGTLASEDDAAGACVAVVPGAGVGVVPAVLAVVLVLAAVVLEPVVAPAAADDEVNWDDDVVEDVEAEVEVDGEGDGLARACRCETTDCAWVTRVDGSGR